MALVDITRLSKVQEDVMLALAYGKDNTGKPMTMWDVARATRTHRRNTSQYYPVVHKVMKQLQAGALVEVAGRGTGMKGAKTLLFDLTKFGRWVVLSQVDRLDFSRLAKARRGQPGMPTYFEAWDYLKSMNVAQVAERLLRAMAHRLLAEASLDIQTIHKVSYDLDYPGWIMYAMVPIDPTRMLSAEIPQSDFWPGKNEEERRRFIIAHYINDTLNEIWSSAMKEMSERFDLISQLMESTRGLQEHLRKAVLSLKGQGKTDEEIVSIMSRKREGDDWMLSQH